jgi:hypothetical protein
MLGRHASWREMAERSDTAWIIGGLRFPEIPCVLLFETGIGVREFSVGQP